jgi:hypothetical protein
MLNNAKTDIIKNRVELSDFCSIAIVLAFAVFCAGFSVSKGLNAADDAWHANLAQNIALGKGYTVPWTYSYDQSKPVGFHPFNSCGPAFIVPIAFGIWLLPFSEAVPGLCSVGLWFFLLLATGILLRSFLTGAQVLSVTSVFITCALLAFGWHLEQWYTSLGEVAGTLYLLVSIILLSRAEGRVGILISGIVFSLALLTKLIMLMAAPCFFVLLFSRSLQSVTLKEKIYRFCMESFFFGIGVLIPQFGYESIKLLNLGANGYAEHWKIYFNVIVSDGLAGAKESLFGMVQNRFKLLHDRFGVWQPGLVLIVGLGFAPLVRGMVIRRIALGLSTAILSLGAYWLFKSLGWPRYFCGPLILSFALVSLLVGISSRKNLLALMLLIVLTYSDGAPKLFYAITGADNGLFRLSSDRIERAAAVTKLKQVMENRDSQILYSSWWAGVADLIYHLRGNVQYVKFDHTGVLSYRLNSVYATNLKFGDKVAAVHRNTMTDWHPHYSSSKFIIYENK